MSRHLPLLFAIAFAAWAPHAAAQKEPPAPNYICPNADSKRDIDCFLDAVEHLYTMCRNVKSIEVLEFGYEKSEEGVNGAKTEYCIDKHKISMTRPYQGALREATGSRDAVDGLRSLYDLWLNSLAQLKWIPGETDAAYKERTIKPYAEFSERTVLVRTAMPAATATAAAKTKTKAAASKTNVASKEPAPAKDASKRGN